VIVDDDPAALAFSVEVGDSEPLEAGLGDDVGALLLRDDSAMRRRYLTTLVRSRLHQRTFRERVLEAYRRQCAFCRLRHEELLDAAHIVPDSQTEGEPRVPNGLALCT